MAHRRGASSIERPGLQHPGVHPGRSRLRAPRVPGLSPRARERLRHHGAVLVGAPSRVTLGPDAKYLGTYRAFALRHPHPSPPLPAPTPPRPPPPSPPPPPPLYRLMPAQPLPRDRLPGGVEARAEARRLTG